MPSKLNLPRVWADIEDSLVPYFRLEPSERALYYHLLRHSRLCGKRTVFLSKRMLAGSSGMSVTTVQDRLRGLARKGCLNITRRDYFGQLIEVLLPAEIPGCVLAGTPARSEHRESANCHRNRKLRRAIFQRERGRCFYCRRKLFPKISTTDHVIPAVNSGDHSFRNVVACCTECNRRKSSHPAAKFLHSLVRLGRLPRRDLPGRLRALRALQRGRSSPSPRRNQYR